MGYERCSVDFAVGYEMQYGVAVAAVDPAGLEGEVFAVHFRQGENLGGIIHCNNGDNGIGSGAFPCHSECFIASGSLNHPVCPSMGAVTQDKLPAFFRGSHQNIRIVLSYEICPVGVLFADYNPFWLFKHRAEQGAYSGRSGSDDENCVIFVYLRYFGGPIACGKNVSDKNRLLVAYGIRNDAQSPVGMRDSHIFGLSAVYPASEGPSSVRVGAVVDISVPAEEAFPAECLDIDGNPVSGLDFLHISSGLLHCSDHLMSDGYAGDGPRHAPVLDVQVTGADAGECHLHNGVIRIFQSRLFFLQQCEMTFPDICVGLHIYLLIMRNHFL